MDLCIAKNAMPIVAAQRIDGDTPGDWAARKVAADAGAIISEGVESVDDLARGADSLRDMRGELFGLYPSMPIDELADTLSEAMIVARLAGMYEVDNGD